MEHTYYRIGEVSRVTGISKDTLHFYNKIGLLVPDHIDPDNQYRYYSLRNLWQLDIITTCRKLNIPLETVRQILSLRDNGEITRLLMEYRQEAIRLSRYYQQVAEDISWYGEEKERIERQKDRTEIQKKWLEEEVVIAGSFSKDARSYHASLQDAAKEELRHAPSIRRKYGYMLDMGGVKQGKVIKCREYLKLGHQEYTHISPEHLYRIPAGTYLVFNLQIRNEEADFSPLLGWLAQNRQEIDAVYAEELGLQLFPYLDNYYCEVRAHLKTEKSS